MRVVKDAQVRKNEILDAAAMLFSEKGFDDTSTNDILSTVGIARGTLYYHFKSKEDIMDALIERQTSHILAEAQKIAGDSSISVEQRILRTVKALKVENQANGKGGKEIMEHLHQPQNALMHQKTQQVMIQRVPKILAQILEDGVKQGLFHTPFPLECMEMVVIYLDTVFDSNMIVLDEQQRASRIDAFIFHLERLLGVNSGGLRFMKKLF